jgi:hypothetical protein
MPGIVDPPPLPGLTTKQPNNKLAKAAPQKPTRGTGDHDQLLDKKREAKLLTAQRTSQNVSNIRAMRKKGVMEDDDDEDTQDHAPAVKLQKNTRLSVGAASRVTRSSKRTIDDYDDGVSPTALSFAGGISSQTPSRAATPLEQPAVKKRRGPKTKTS